MLTAKQPDGSIYTVPFFERQESDPQDVPRQMMIPQVVFNRTTNCAHIYAASLDERDEILPQVLKLFSIEIPVYNGQVALGRHGLFHYARINCTSRRSPKGSAGKSRG